MVNEVIYNSDNQLCAVCSKTTKLMLLKLRFSF